MTSSLPSPTHANNSTMTSEHPMESPSDNDVSERQTRERLKKASLSSLSGAASEFVGAGETLDHVIMSSQDHQEQVPATDMDCGEDFRGRLGRKRSADDLVATEDSDTLGSSNADTKVGHTRKRSRDVRNGESQILEDRRQGSPSTTLLEEAEESVDNKRIAKASIEADYKESAGKDTPPCGSEIIDEEMQESIRSPRKKRSRDLAEADSHREQKIAATDENRARRRSSSEDRKEESETQDATVESKEKKVLGDQVVPGELSSVSQTKDSTAEVPRSSGFANTFIGSPFANIAKQESPNTDSPPNNDNGNQQSQTSPSAFAASGFAALANSTSPFGVLGSTKGDPKTSQLSPTSPFAALSSPQTEKSKSTDFSAPPSGLSSTASPFTSSTLPGFGGLGGFASSSGFGTGFGSGSKLTSFAAPTGDAKLGVGGAKPVGASADTEEEEKDSETGTGNEEEEKVIEKVEVDSKFQKQEMDTGEEGEDTLFQARGKLFEYTSSGEWAERGIGPFKLNVTRPDPEVAEEDRTIGARFLMRAQHTHRVMLNTRVFKEMKISDSRGNAPSGKTVMFSAVHEGKVVPFLFKTRNEEDIKTLYREVTKLQRDL